MRSRIALFGFEHIRGSFTPRFMPDKGASSIFLSCHGCGSLALPRVLLEAQELLKSGRTVVVMILVPPAVAGA